MQISSLRYFIKLAEAQSFYAAAKEVYLSQQGLNKAITTLENEIGSQLLIRSNRGVQLTPAGIEVLSWARTITDDYHRMLDAVMEVDNGDSAATRIHRASLSYFCMQLLSSIKFDERKSAVALFEAPLTEIFDSLKRGDTHELFYCELFGRARALLAAEGHADIMPLVAGRVGIAVNVANKFSGRSSVSPAELRGLPYAANSNAEFVEYAREIFGHALPDNVQVKTTNQRLIYQFAQNNPDGYCMTDSFVYCLMKRDASENMESLVFVPFDVPEAYFEICALKNRRVQHPDIQIHNARKVRSLLAEYFPDYFAQYCTQMR